SVQISADALLPAMPARQGRKRAEAEEWLAEELAQGPAAAKDLLKRGSERGFSESTLSRACKALGVQRKKLGLKDGWQWYIPEGTGTEDANSGPGEAETGGFGETKGKPALSPEGVNSHPSDAFAEAFDPPAWEQSLPPDGRRPD